MRGNVAGPTAEVLRLLLPMSIRQLPKNPGSLPGTWTFAIEDPEIPQLGEQLPPATFLLGDVGRLSNSDVESVDVLIDTRPQEAPAQRVDEMLAVHVGAGMAVVAGIDRHLSIGAAVGEPIHVDIPFEGDGIDECPVRWWAAAAFTWVVQGHPLARLASAIPMATGSQDVGRTATRCVRAGRLAHCVDIGDPKSFQSGLHDLRLR
ncbi:hypothetical protein TL08_20025 [Actinoalloteichus hymeniacidonis]|uniref:Uncharacterized protein n=1 Tax=Actinoalloteichus hymeniacidonis TaxID=340345 RepID=A0AAC9HTF0_9PSEU|nr:hypothetical protein TL08_20025 [Actinoalloteichus hymeniacidonis]